MNKWKTLDEWIFVEVELLYYSLCIIEFVLLQGLVWYNKNKPWKNKFSTCQKALLKFNNSTKKNWKYCDNWNRFYLRNNSSFIFSQYMKKNKQAHYSIKIISSQYFMKIKYLLLLTSFPEAKDFIPAIFLSMSAIYTTVFFYLWVTHG